VKPGTPYRDLGNVIQKHADANGFSVVRTFCGHGVHWYGPRGALRRFGARGHLTSPGGIARAGLGDRRLFHTTPNIPHYASTIERPSVARKHVLVTLTPRRV